ncbi:MAG: hypothetical protein H7250_04050 [Flavobacterium sp.]|jgi:hypothetical protein|nr:hypothetical protein [Flavobacterium sp.]
MKRYYDLLFNKKDIPKKDTSKENIPKINWRLKYLSLHYFTLQIPSKDVYYQLKLILGENLLEYCISCQHGSTDCLLVLQNRITKQDCSFLRIQTSDSGSYIIPKVSRVSNKKQYIQSLQTKNCFTNITTKKKIDPTIYIKVESVEDLENVDKIIQTLDSNKRPDVVLALNYPGSNLNSVKSQLKPKNKILDEIDPTVEMLNLVPPMLDFDKEWIEDRDFVSRDPFSEQLFNLEKNLQNIQTQKIDFLFYNLDSFGVRIVCKEIPMQRMKKLIEQFQQKMHTFLEKMLLKNIVQMGPIIPMTPQLFPIFLSQAGSGFKRMKTAKSIQLNLVYLLLYFSDLKMAEIITLTKNNLLDLMEKGSTEILLTDFHSDTNRMSKKLSQMKKKLPDLVSYPIQGNSILSEKLKEKQKEINLLFDTYEFSCIGSNPQKMKGVRSLGDEKFWLGIISMDLMHTASVLDLSGKFSASSFKKKKQK